MPEQNDPNAEMSLPPVTAPAAEFFTAAERMYDAGKLDEAISAYRAGLQKDPSNIVAVNNLAMVFIEKERYTDALDELESALRRGARDPELYSNLGYALRRMGRDADAASAYEEYLKSCSDPTESDRIRKWIDKVRATYAETATPATPAAAVPATTTTAAAPATSPMNADAFLSQAHTAYEREAYDEALALYDRVLLLDTENAQALAGRGQALAKLGQMEEALASLREAVTLDERDSASWYVLGIVLRGMSRSPEAADAFARYLELVPDAENADRIRAWVNEVQSRQRRVGSGQTSAPAEDEPLDDGGSQAMAEDEPAAQPVEDVSVAEVEVDVPVAPGATAAQEPAVSDAPMFAASPEAASADMMSVLDAAFGLESEEEPPSQEMPLEPPSFEQRLEQAYSVMGKGDSAGALTLAKTLLTEQPDSLSALLLCARCHGQLRRFQEATEVLRQILDHEENDEALYLFGRCEEELGDPEAAMEMFRRCAECTKDRELRESAMAHIHDLTPAAAQVLCPSCGKRVPEDKLVQREGEGEEAVCTECMQAFQNKSDSVRVEAHTPHTPKKKRGCCFCCLGLVVAVVLLHVALAVTLWLFPSVIFQPVIDAVLADPEQRASLTEQLQDISDEEIAEGEKVFKELGLKLDLMGLKYGTWGTKQKPGQKGGVPGATGPGGKEVEKIVYRVVAEPEVRFLPGVPHELTVKVEPPAPDGTEVKITYTSSRAPSVPVAFDPETGTLQWCPDIFDADAGGISVTFQAAVGKENATAATTRLYVLPMPSVQPLGVDVPPRPFLPGDALYLAAGDLNGDGRDEILSARGQNAAGTLACFARDGAAWREVSTVAIERRPLGLAVLPQGAAVLVTSDAVHLYDLKDGVLTPRADNLALPAEGMLCAFGNPDGEGGPGLAVMCPALRQIVVFESVGGQDLVPYHRIPMPEKPLAWKGMQLADLVRSGEEAGQEVLLWTAGRLQPNLFVHKALKDETWQTHTLGSGAVLRFGWRNLGDANGAGELALLSGMPLVMLQTLPAFLPGQRAPSTPVALDEKEPPLALSTADLDGNGLDDLVVLRRDGMIARFWTSPAVAAQIPRIPLPRDAAVPMGATATVRTEGKRQGIIYADRSGRLQLLQMKPDAGEDQK